MQHWCSNGRGISDFSRGVGLGFCETEEAEAALSAAFLMRFIVLLCVFFWGAIAGWRYGV